MIPLKVKILLIVLLLAAVLVVTINQKELQKEQKKEGIVEIPIIIAGDNYLWQTESNWKMKTFELINKPTTILIGNVTYHIRYNVTKYARWDTESIEKNPNVLQAIENNFPANKTIVIGFMKDLRGFSAASTLVRSPNTGSYYIVVSYSSGPEGTYGTFGNLDDFIKSLLTPIVKDYLVEIIIK